MLTLVGHGNDQNKSNESDADLLAAALGGSQAAWDAMVDRYSGLVWWAIRGFRLSEADAAEVSQTVWLKLLENAHRVRDPKCLGGWLVSTSRNACAAVLRTSQRTCFDDDLDSRVGDIGELDGAMLDDERRQAVDQAVTVLSQREQQLLGLLTAEPRLSYEHIAETLAVRIGSIGPTRQRIIAKLRRHPSVAALLWDSPLAA